MQSQQKKVKWSRGETSSALEERTDTGITNVSVARMENCIADIYGNVSRRPAFKIVPSSVSPYISTAGAVDFTYNMGIFSISRTEYIVMAINRFGSVVNWWLIRGGVCAKVGRISFSAFVPLTGATSITFAQYNNYMVVFGFARPFILRYNSTSEELVAEEFKFTGPWYAPAGTTSETINSTTIPGLEFNKDQLGFVAYTYTENGESVVLSTIDTGLSASSIDAIKAQIPAGSIVQFPKNGAFMRVEGYHYNGQAVTRMPTAGSGTYPHDRIYMFGSLLAPAVDATAIDTSVKVETGYIQLDAAGGYYPTTGAFSNQRLYVGNFRTTFSANQQFIPGFVVGSQIGRYTDFKNNYNLPNEPINIDMANKFQEVVEYIVDFNGLKILTDAGEYQYADAIIQQSANGAAIECSPITFNSLLLYLDNNQRAVRAMQYEFQQNVFSSSIINDVTPADLIFKPVAFAKSYDKEYSTGNYLYCVAWRDINGFENNPKAPNIAFCNFVPSSQNMIWGRWEGPRSSGKTIINNAIDVDNTVYFLVEATGGVPGVPYGVKTLALAVLDYNNVLDFQTAVSPSATQYQLRFNNGSYYINFPNATVSVFNNGVWQWDDTLDSQGNFTKPLAGLSNPTVGFMINATLDSHPVDIGGKTKSVVKRISKAIMSVRDTEPGAITINGKTGYMNPAKDMINFYGITGMKREITYKITNIKGAKFHLESLLLNLEYGTLIS